MIPIKKLIMSTIFLMTAILPSKSFADLEKRFTEPIPETFPHFIIPGYDQEMASLRHLHYLHYGNGAVGSALWHAWMPGASVWPAVSRDSSGNKMAEVWAKKMSEHFIDAEGYVSSDMGQNFAHNLGWPFPHWTQAAGAGWHFTLSNLPDMSIFGLFVEEDTTGWILNGVDDKGIDKENGWQIELDKRGATLATPLISVEKEATPFLRISWEVKNFNPRSNPYLEWITGETPEFSSKHRVYFTMGSGREFDYNDEAERMIEAIIPLSELSDQDGPITRFRINFGDNAGAKITIRSIITAVDSRHNVNNFTFIKGCSDYVGWTRDLAFLRTNIQRMRLAMHWALDEFQVEKYKCVYTPWVGHDGRSGLEILSDGTKVIHKGRGIGNGYFDLLPFGGRDALTTIYCYDAMKRMASLERQIAEHPEWNIPAGPLRFEPEKLEKLAGQMKTSNEMFWNSKTGRFAAAIDVDGQKPDYGLTFVNLEAIHYGYANEKQAHSIMDWITGKRVVEGDTSQGEDIYYWRFAPRCTTKRNIEYYNWVWSNPETIPFGGQIQDGGAVLGFSYHDIMSRIAVYGPDDAWQRLCDILDWFDEIVKAGGYRKYYEKIPDASLQGGGTAGGLGLDLEFVENILLPQVMMHGFMGFYPRADGIELNPQLPSNWPSLKITRVDYHSMICDITATANKIRIDTRNGIAQPFKLYLQKGTWQIRYLDNMGKEVMPTGKQSSIEKPQDSVEITANKAIAVELSKIVQ